MTWLERYEREQERIVVLSFEDARQQAETLLADPRKFACVISPSNGPLNLLAPGLQALFSRFDSIHVVDDEAFLSRQEIAPLDWDGNGLSWGLPLWKIGQAHGHSLTLIKPNEEAVYDSTDDELGETYPGIYHWLLWVSALASDFGS